MAATTERATHPTGLFGGACRRVVSLLAMLLLLAACSTSGTAAHPGAAGTDAADDQLVVHANDVVAPFDPQLLGTNVPAWLLPDLVANDDFRALTVASGVTMLRLPGGSWSNDYDWLGCEQGDATTCDWTWAMRPSDFISLIEATDLPAMWTVSINGTAQEAAAAVAFFNGSVDDPTPIGTDRRGVDWSTVGHWAQLRAEHGHPNPAGIRDWEVGNEVYGAVASAGPKCASWGWENVWTCDGTEYVEGNADHDGFRQFSDAMRAVDTDIRIGAVGVGASGEWNDWDDAVMGAAGDSIDFYVVHHYGSNGDVAADKVLGLPSSQWPGVTKDVRATAADHGLDSLPIAVTEHNLVAFIDGDDEKLMPSALNAFYLAESIGQMALHGVSIANQWNLANGRAANGSDYGLFDAQTHERSPAYYAMALWSRVGAQQLVAVDAGPALKDLVVYAATAADGSPRLFVMNPGASSVDAAISFDPAVQVGHDVAVDVVQAPSLDATQVSFNGSSNPSTGLTEPSTVVTASDDGSLRQAFAPYTLTVLRWTAR